MRVVRNLTNEEIAALRKSDAKVSPHAFDRLDESQRGIYDSAWLKRYLKQRPHKAVLQANGRMALLYREKQDYVKVIVEGRTIVTFLRLKRVQR